MDAYLQTCPVIDHGHPEVQKAASQLRSATGCQQETVKRCFEFVRDEIRHSWDFRINPVTCAASHVLEAGTGFCFAKSHLLAALLRANGIPAGLCYQRLSLDDSEERFCLHGLNAVYLQEHGWYRLDPRGNKLGVTSECRPPVEQLAYAIRLPGERDIPKIYERPLPQVVEVLQISTTYEEVAENLPDLP
ncbi:transglutaminase family protein [Microbulbifer sp. CAU 1566]|uniref:transglutaminase-like domain-containing protein n=1 Tax=Microbulbifer sp. CAU 1566 TaxID=2933269 RepID=UPI002002D09D|nr:transglutaminase family protein [Microbulbifer sp. CAU 1566]MCK7598469.1 transglutaminase family protein [Microbulbifer sp. CAU 1566]